MATKLRAGVIGAGSWAVASHIPNLLSRPDDVELVGVNRPDDDLLEWVRAEFDVPTATTDYRELLESNLDLVIVSSPAGVHHEHARAALESGAHVLVEKPFTLDPRDAWDLVETADRLGRHLVVALGWNYKPMVVEAKAMLTENGGLGSLEHMMIDMSSAARELLSTGAAYEAGSSIATPRTETYTDPATSGGGYGQAQLSHALGLGFWLSGDVEPIEVFAMTAAPLDAPVELHDAFVVRFAGGGVASVSGTSCHAGFADNKHQLAVRIIGSTGMVEVDVGRELVAWHRPPADEVRLDLDGDAGDYDCDGPVHTLIDLALGRPVPNRSPGWLGARAVEVTDAAYRSAASGTVASVAR